MTLRRRHGFHNAYINLTPLIDMSLMLVVFFVLCLTTSQAVVRSLPVTLPEAASSVAPASATLEVVIEKGGAISVDGHLATIADLHRLAAGAARVSLLADRDCRHGRVVDIVDALRAAGVKDVFYATATKPFQDW